MSGKFNIEGKIIIESGSHEIEYEPSSMVGLGTLFLRVKEAEHVVPIHVNQIDDVMEMMSRGKAVIEIFEGR